MFRFCFICLFLLLPRITLCSDCQDGYLFPVCGKTDSTISVVVGKDTIIANKTKGEALLWWALGGVVGLHRIYLGTRPVVPVFYALTLGGGMGILFVSDLIAIIVTKDINRYANNENIIMWVSDKPKKQP